MDTTTQLDTKSLFKAHFICWRILGMSPPRGNLRPLYRLYSLVLNVVVTVGYPLHLTLGLFISSSMYEVIQNLAITFTCTVCAMKTFAIWWRLPTVNVMFDIIQRQDTRLSSKDEVYYLKYRVYPVVRRIILIFYTLCSVIGVSGELSVLVSGLLGNWQLMYKAYFPFDVFGSKWKYIAAHLYQFIGISYMIMQNGVNDTFAATHLALLGGQVRMLSIRVAKIGHDVRKSQMENYEDLLDCIQTHKDLLVYYRQLEYVIAVYMFFQILVAAVNMCVVLVFVILFVKDPFIFAYYCSYFMGLVFEILPSCYYGTLLEDEFQDLSYAFFSCNWPDQTFEFKKSLRVAVEQAIRRIHVTAWMFPINNNAFIFACKNSYALFTLVMNLK